MTTIPQSAPSTSSPLFPTLLWGSTPSGEQPRTIKCQRPHRPQRSMKQGNTCFACRACASSQCKGCDGCSAAAWFSRDKSKLPVLRRKAQSKETKLYGASVMGVGVGAVAFHASSGKLRHWGRKLDYWVSTEFKQTLHPCQHARTDGTRGKQRALFPHLICGHASLGMSPSARPVFIVQLASCIERLAPCKYCMAAWQQCCLLMQRRSRWGLI